MKPRIGYLESLLAGTLAILLAYTSFCFALDPLRVFGTSHFDRKNFEPDTRYVQFAYLEHHPQPNAFVLGSSRVNFYDVGVLDRLTGLRFYNLSASIESFQGIEQKVAWLLKNRPVAAVVIGLDYDLYDVRADRTDLQHVDPPQISGEWPLEFYARDLLIPPDLLRDCIVGNLRSTTGYRFHVRTGEYWIPQNAFAPGDHLVDRGRFPAAVALGQLRTTIDMLRTHHVAYTLIVPPYSQARLMQFDPAGYVRWLRAVVAIGGPVWDFGDDNSVARNLHNYLDISHFDGRVGTWVLTRVFAGPAAQAGIPRDFGVLVTPRSVAAHLERVRLALDDAKARTRPVVASVPDADGQRTASTFIP